MNYFILWAGALYPGERTRRLEGDDWAGLEAGAFIDGVKIERAITQPIDIDLIEDDKGDAVLPPLFVVPALVLRKDVAQALQECGVDNIDYYPAVLHDRRRKKHWNDYMVGNVLGLMDVIDMRRSVLDPGSPPEVAMIFETMVIDEKKCRGQKLFRLMHRQNLVVISQEVADHLRSKSFPFLHIVSPEDFA